MSDYRINVRMNTLKKVDLKKRNRHDYRKYTENEIRDNINKLNNDNVYVLTEEQEEEKLNEYEKLFNKKYKERSKRAPQSENVTPFLEGIITFPHEYQNVQTDKNLWNKCLKNFIDLLYKKTGIKVLNVIEHNDETTRHYHLKLTNFYINNDGILVNNLLRKKGRKSQLQDIAGEAFSELGLRRGNKKSLTNSKNQTKREWVNNETEKMTEALEDGKIDLTEIEELIKTSSNPFKLFYTKYKRLMGYELEAKKTQEQIDKLNKNILKKFPKLEKYNENENMSNIDLLELLIDKLEGSKKMTKAQTDLIKK